MTEMKTDFNNCLSMVNKLPVLQQLTLIIIYNNDDDDGDDNFSILIYHFFKLAYYRLTNWGHLLIEI